MDIKHITIKVCGTVQGVWFRKSAKEKAEELGLIGFVVNNDDGSVTIEAYGVVSDIEKLLKWSYEGSRLADVDSVNYEIDNNLIYKKDNFEIL